MKRFLLLCLSIVAAATLVSCDPPTDVAPTQSVAVLKSVTCEDFGFTLDLEYNSNGKLSNLVEQYIIGDPGDQFTVSYTYTIVYTNELILVKKVNAENGIAYNETSIEYTLNSAGMVTECLKKSSNVGNETVNTWQSEYTYDNDTYLAKIEYLNEYNIETLYSWDSAKNIVKMEGSADDDDYAHYGYGTLSNEIYSVDMNSVLLLFISDFNIEQMIKVAGASSSNVMESVILGGGNYSSGVYMSYETTDSGRIEKAFAKGENNIAADIIFTYE
ncbi:MAG: hypothetical protein SNH79_01870 [Rikenellaceae bacterium]